MKKITIYKILLIASFMNATPMPYSQDANLPVPRSIFAKFTQSVESKSKKLVYKGDFIVTGNDSTKWQYLSPTRKEICGKGNIFKIVDHDLEQATYYRSREAIDVRMLIREARKYNDNIYTTKMNNISYTFRINKDNHVDQIVYRDSMDNIVRLKLYDVVYTDIDIPDKYLECHTPSGFDAYGVE